MAQDAGMESWKTPDVVAWLHRNDMEALAPIFEENEVTGLDLILLTEDEMRSMMNISKLQAAKIKRLVNTTTSDTTATETSDASADTGADPAGDEDPAATTDFKGTAPKISDREEDLGEDEEERSELRRAGTGVQLHEQQQYNQPIGQPPADTANSGQRAAPDTAPVAASAPPPPPQPQPAYTGPFLPAGTGALQLDSGTVQRYQQSVTTISNLEAEQVQQQLPAARSRLASTQKRLKLQETKFEELRQDEAKRNEKLGKLTEGKWYPGKYLFGRQKHEDKVQRNTVKLESVSNQVRAAGCQLEELHAQVADQTKNVSELTAKCAALDEARGFCASLLQSAFAGLAVGDARENSLETEVASLGPKLEEVRRYKAVYGKAYELMRGSREALDQAHQLLQSAAGLATVDVMSNVIRPQPFRNSPGGLMVDMIKRAQMRQGVQLCKASGELAIKARALVPDMPRVNAEKLQRLRVGFGLMDVVFDNMVSDLIAAAKIRKMLGVVRETVSDVTYAERWLQGWIKGRIDEDLRNLDALLATRRSELHSHRMALMQQWIDARSRGAVYEAPPSQQQQIPAIGVPAQRQWVL